MNKITKLKIQEIRNICGAMNSVDAQNITDNQQIKSTSQKSEAMYWATVALLTVSTICVTYNTWQHESHRLYKRIRVRVRRNNHE